MTSLHRRRFPSQQVLTSPDHVDVLTRAGRRGASRHDWLATGAVVLARSLYRVQRFDLTSAAPSQRRAALAGLLLAWSPFERSEFAAVVSGSVGLGLAWDAETEVALRGPGPPRRAPRLLPELLLRQPHDEGLRVVQTLEGCEAQLWHQGMPLVSRWWPMAPGGEDWDAFVRDTEALVRRHGLTALSTLPPPAVDPGWLRRPWVASFNPRQAESALAHWERLAYTALSCGLLGLTGLAAHRAVQAYQQLDWAQAQQQQLRIEISPALAARERALGLATRAQALSQTFATVLPIELLSAVAQALPARGVTLRELDYTESRLVIGLELAPELQRASVIDALQASAWFADVKEGREQPGRNWARFEMKLNGLQPPVSRAVRIADAAVAEATAVPVVPGTAALPAARPASR